MGLKIGLVSTRFSGTDGVSLEAAKWAEVFESNGHRCFWFAGELDKNPSRSMLVPEAHFSHDRNRSIASDIFGTNRRSFNVTESIHDLRHFLKKRIYRFIDRFGIDLLIVENALTIPMHLPLGIALSEVIAETQIPAIAHHHDFYWERTRFLVNSVSDYLSMAFPPNLPNIRHVVINSAAQEQLALRTGISSNIIPNVLDFDHPPIVDTSKSADFKRAIGLDPEDVIILQPTRIIQRKGIEHAIELVKRLGKPQNKIVISHKAGDEGYDYANWLTEYAAEQGVDLRLIETHLSAPGTCRLEEQGRYSLWDVYPHASFVTFPSLSEGFGNAFLEALYFRKPILINRYATFVKDIEPLGFDLVVMDGYVTKSTVRQVDEVLRSDERRLKMVSTNYAIATKYYAYTVLCDQLNPILRSFFGNSSNLLQDVSTVAPAAGCIPGERAHAA